MWRGRIRDVVWRRLYPIDPLDAGWRCAYPAYGAGEHVRIHMTVNAPLLMSTAGPTRVIIAPLPFCR